MYGKEHNGGGLWQRAFLDGSMDRDDAYTFCTNMNREDNILAICRPYIDSTDPEFKDFKRWLFSINMTYIPVTRESSDDGTFREHTRVMTSSGLDFDDEWQNLIPETGLCDDMDARESVRSRAMGVTLVDMTWRRSKHLFDTVIKVLEGRTRRVPVTGAVGQPQDHHRWS